MADHYLKFEDEAAADAALSAAGMASRQGATYAVDHVGTVWTDAVLDGGGNVIAEPVAETGWHVNLRLLSGDLPGSLAAAEVFPATPYRRFA